jgi:hypothetical protein
LSRFWKTTFNPTVACVFLRCCDLGLAAITSAEREEGAADLAEAGG